MVGLVEAAGRLREKVLRDKVGRAFVSGGMWTFLIGASGAAVGLGVQVLLARTLGHDEYGLYVYVLGWMNAALVVVKAELDTTATRFVAAYDGSGHRDNLSGVVRALPRYVMNLSVGTAAVAALGLFLFRARLTPGQLGAALLACVILPISAVGLVYTNILQGLHLMRQAYIPQQLLRPIAMATLLGTLFLAAPHHVHAVTAIAFNCLAALFGLIVLNRSVRVAVQSRGGIPTDRERNLWFATAMGILPAAIAQQVLGQTTDVLVVGTMLGTSLAGIYGVASQLSGLAGYILGPVSATAAPMISRLHAQGDRVGLRRLLRLVAWTNLGLVVPLGAGVILLGPWLLRIFGPNFAAGYPTLVILTISITSAALGGHAGFVLTMTGNERFAARIIIISAVSNLLLSILLTQHYGMIGTALATCVCTIFRNVMMVWQAQRKVGVSLMPW